MMEFAAALSDASISSAALRLLGLLFKKGADWHRAERNVPLLASGEKRTLAVIHAYLVSAGSVFGEIAAPDLTRSAFQKYLLTRFRGRNVDDDGLDLRSPFANSFVKDLGADLSDFCSEKRLASSVRFRVLRLVALRFREALYHLPNIPRFSDLAREVGERQQWMLAKLLAGGPLQATPCSANHFSWVLEEHGEAGSALNRLYVEPEFDVSVRNPNDRSQQAAAREPSFATFSLLDAVRALLLHPKPSRVLRIEGNPGSGLSTVARFLCFSLENECFSPIYVSAERMKLFLPNGPPEGLENALLHAIEICDCQGSNHTALSELRKLHEIERSVPHFRRLFDERFPERHGISPWLLVVDDIDRLTSAQQQLFWSAWKRSFDEPHFRMIVTGRPVDRNVPEIGASDIGAARVITIRGWKKRQAREYLARTRLAPGRYEEVLRYVDEELGISPVLTAAYAKALTDRGRPATVGTAERHWEELLSTIVDEELDQDAQHRRQLQRAALPIPFAGERPPGSLFYFGGQFRNDVFRQYFLSDWLVDAMTAIADGDASRLQEVLAVLREHSLSRLERRVARYLIHGTVRNLGANQLARWERLRSMLVDAWRSWLLGQSPGNAELSGGSTGSADGRLGDGIFALNAWVHQALIHRSLPEESTRFRPAGGLSWRQVEAGFLRIYASLRHEHDQLTQPTWDLSYMSLSTQGDQSGGSRTLLGMDLSGASLSGVDLSGVILARASLVDATATGGAFIGTDLGHAHLTKVKFGSAILTGADLRQSTLQCADLNGANLERARLERADLRGASFHGSNLTEASLAGAIAGDCWDGDNRRTTTFDGATVTPEQLASLVWIAEP